jgi:sec-independent protein translocase protein TatA
MFGLGAPELIVIFLVAFVLFGSKKLPEIGAGLGKAIGTFKRGLNEVEEAKTEFTKDLPGVQEATKVKETLDSAKNITNLLKK